MGKPGESNVKTFLNFDEGGSFQLRGALIKYDALLSVSYPESHM